MSVCLFSLHVPVPFTKFLLKGSSYNSDSVAILRVGLSSWISERIEQVGDVVKLSATDS